MTVLALADEIDPERLAATYRATSRVVIEPFLDSASATALAAHLVSRSDWRLVLNSGDKVFEIGRAEFEAMPATERARIDAAVVASARDGFQFRYDTIRVPDDAGERARRGDPIDLFAEWMAAPATLGLLRGIVGSPDVDFADAQATAYRPGDFLNAHDDNVPGKGRRAAYVLGLTPDWRTEWGGLLLFHDRHRVEGLVPGFNRLTLFRVPQIHSVSHVTPLALRPRYSITGWLRSVGRT